MFSHQWRHSFGNLSKETIFIASLRIKSIWPVSQLGKRQLLPKQARWVWTHLRSNGFFILSGKQTMVLLGGRRWAASHRGSILASHPTAPGSIPSAPEIVGRDYQWRWLEENGQWLENVDRTHLGLASGRPALQINWPCSSSSPKEMWHQELGLILAIAETRRFSFLKDL